MSTMNHCPHRWLLPSSGCSCPPRHLNLSSPSVPLPSQPTCQGHSSFGLPSKFIISLKTLFFCLPFTNATSPLCSSQKIQSHPGVPQPASQLHSSHSAEPSHLNDPQQVFPSSSLLPTHHSSNGLLATTSNQWAICKINSA